MKAYHIYKELSKESWWSKQSRAMRWIAARYYAGVESVDELAQRAEIQFVSPLVVLKATLTATEVETIISLR